MRLKSKPSYILSKNPRLNFILLGAAIIIAITVFLAHHLFHYNRSNEQQVNNFKVVYIDYSIKHELPEIAFFVNDSMYLVRDSLKIKLSEGTHNLVITNKTDRKQKHDTVRIEDYSDQHIYHISYKLSDKTRLDGINHLYKKELSRHENLDTLTRKIIYDKIAMKQNAVIDSFQKLEVFTTFFLNRSKTILCKNISQH